MELLFPILALLGVFSDPDGAQMGRREALSAVLDQAIRLEDERLERRDGQLARPVPDPVERDLVEMELEAGYLDGSCVYRDDRVRRLRLMRAYVTLLRAIGVDDERIAARLVERAGDEGPRVAELIDFAGLDGIEHFICLDYLRAALRAGVPPEDLAGYVDAVPGPTRVAAVP